MPDEITAFVRACEPSRSLDPSDPRYVNLDEVRGEDLTTKYERHLRRAEKSEFLLFAGHRGVGKTSELLRLKHRLEHPAAGESAFQVVYFDVTDSLDPNDLEFADLLVLIASEVPRQFKAAGVAGFDRVSEKLASIWGEIKELLGSEIAIKEGEIEMPFGKLALEIRNRPTARRALRNAVELHNTSLLEAVNDLLDRAAKSLREQQQLGPVLIVDGLDKLVFRRIDEGQSNTHFRLFCDRADQLTNLHSHTIYTVPISLIYSPRCAELEQSFGFHIAPLPMIRLRGHGRSKVSPDTPGMTKMFELVAARCRFANVDVSRAFDDLTTIHFLCEMTGGHPRHLLMFLQAAANSLDTLPITRAAAEKAITNYANSLMREIPHGLWEKLRKFGNPTTEILKDDEHQQMLFLLYVFEYMNSEQWYEVNPVVRSLPKFSERA
jgi:hypothetical protein